MSGVEDKLRAIATAAGLDYDRCIEEDWTLVRFAAAVSGFDMCDECGGSGMVVLDNGSYFEPANEATCAHCKGEGMVARGGRSAQAG